MSGCWIWVANQLQTGYGRMGFGSREKRYTHRLAYEVFVGPIGVGLEIDHLCRTPQCCNPAHLEAVTHHTNPLRGEGRAAKNAQKTHCPRGHELAGENLFVHSGSRFCRECGRIRQRERRDRLGRESPPLADLEAELREELSHKRAEAVLRKARAR
jgi:hypothetical protein